LGFTDSHATHVKLLYVGQISRNTKQRY